MKSNQNQEAEYDIHDALRAIRKQSKKEERREYNKDHLFDILNLIISLLALIISIFGLYLPKS